MTAARTPAPPPVAGGRRKSAPGAEAARLYRLGLTMAEFAGIFQVSAWVIGSRLDEAGVARRAPGGQGSLPLDRAVRQYRRQPHLLGELSVNLGDGRWFNLRPSNTEPLLRLNVEAPTREAMTPIRDEVLALVR